MKFKRLFTLLLGLIMLPIIPAFAQKSPMSEADVDAILVARGYPQMVLDEMSMPAKESICKDATNNFNGAVVIIYQEETGSFDSYEISENGIMPVGQIPTGDLSIVLDTASERDSNGDELIKVTCSYKWKVLPTFRLQDPIAISWDDKLFEMKDGSFHKIDKYDAALVDPITGIVTSYANGQIHSEEYGYARGFSAGVTWYADLKGHNLMSPTISLYGAGEFRLRKKTPAFGSSTIYVHYVHAKIGVGAGINIGDYGSFSVTGISNYDECGGQKTFRY